MTFEEARAAIYARLNTAWSVDYASVLVEYENRDAIDLATQADPWISCELVFNDGENASIEEIPMVRYRGAVYLTSWVKEGQGTVTPLTHLGYLASLFKNQAFGGVKTEAPRPLPKITRQHMDGWEGYPLRIPFWFDQRG